MRMPRCAALSDCSGIFSFLVPLPFAAALALASILTVELIGPLRRFLFQLLDEAVPLDASLGREVRVVGDGQA
jgi:uncharacterized protein (DUF697 family)